VIADHINIALSCCVITKFYFVLRFLQISIHWTVACAFELSRAII